MVREKRRAQPEDGGDPRVGRRATLDDAACVERVLGGDTEAFRPLVERYHGVVTGLARRLLGRSGADAEDLAQETFVRAFQYLGSLEKRQRFGPWLLQIARSLCRDRLRRLETERRALAERRELIRLESVRAENGGVSSVLAGLPAEEYDVLQLRYFEGLSYDEIAGRMGLTFSQVDHLMRKARSRLARRIAIERRRERTV